MKSDERLTRAALFLRRRYDPAMVAAILRVDESWVDELDNEEEQQVVQYLVIDLNNPVETTASLLGFDEDDHAFIRDACEQHLAWLEDRVQTARRHLVKDRDNQRCMCYACILRRDREGR